MQFRKCSPSRPYHGLCFVMCCIMWCYVGLRCRPHPHPLQSLPPEPPLGRTTLAYVVVAVLRYDGCPPPPGVVCSCPCTPAGSAFSITCLVLNLPPPTHYLVFCFALQAAPGPSYTPEEPEPIFRKLSKSLHPSTEPRPVEDSLAYVCLVAPLAPCLNTSRVPYLGASCLLPLLPPPPSGPLVPHPVFSVCILDANPVRGAQGVFGAA